MKKLISILIGIASVVGVQAQDMKALFVSMPDSIAPLLTKVNREDCIDFLASNMKAEVKNRFGQPTELKKLTDDYLYLQTTSKSSMEMKLLPLNDSVKIVCMVNTVCASACDSEIRFFSAQWQELPKQDYMKLPSVEAFYLPVDSLKEDFLLLREKADMELLKATLSPDSAVLSIAYTTPDYKPSDKHFMVTINASQVAVIIFGDGTFGSIPSAGQKITSASFYITTGIQGNVPAGSIVQTPAIVKASISEATTSNQYAAGGGSSYENFGMLKEHIPLSVKTLGVAVSKQDFVDLAMLVDGVNKAAVDYECGRKLTVYISADNGGVADSAMINKVYTQLSQRAPLTTWLQVKSAGLVDITLEIEVTGKKSYKTNEIQAQVLNALYNAYSIENSEIGGKVRISDIYALIDNLSTVDYLHIKKFYIKPWPVTIYGNKELLLGQFKLEKANGSMTYFINFTGSNSYTVKASSGGFQTTGSVGSTINITDKNNGITFSLDIQANGYQQGYRYSITISEPNMDYEDPGYNLPVFQKSSQLTLTVHETV